MKKWKVSYQVEESPRYERETKEMTVEAATEADARQVAGAEIFPSMVQPGRPYIPFIYGSEKIEEVK